MRDQGATAVPDTDREVRDRNARTKMLTVRDRKDPRAKPRNDQRIPLLWGYDALALIEEQRTIRSNEDDRILCAVHETGAGLHRAGLVDKATLREFDSL